MKNPSKKTASLPTHPDTGGWPDIPGEYWSLPPEQVLGALHASRSGLQPEEADQRLKQYGTNSIEAQTQASALRLLLSQFKSPLVLILIFAAIISGIVKEWVDAIIVLAIVFGSTILGVLAVGIGVRVG